MIVEEYNIYIYREREEQDELSKECRCKVMIKVTEKLKPSKKQQRKKINYLKIRLGQNVKENGEVRYIEVDLFFYFFLEKDVHN